MTYVSNQWIAEQAEQIFANSPSFNAEIAMAGRAEALAEFRRIVLESVSVRTAALSDQLGAGKTFCVQKAIGTFQVEGLLREVEDVVVVDYGQALEDSFLKELMARVLIVEDLDRRSDLEPMKRALEALASWVGDERRLVLSGDRLLENIELLGEFGSEGRVGRVELEPLDERLLREAVELRMYRPVRQLGLDEEAAEAEVKEGVKEMFDPDLMTALLPNTQPPVANFRDVLGILQQMASYLPLDRQPCRFSPDTYLAWIGNSGRTRRRRGEVAEFVENLTTEIRRRTQTGESWRAMHVSEWPWLSNLSADDAERYDAEVMEVLVREKVLLPLGVPYSRPYLRRTAGPYLPTVRTFLAAAFSEATA